MKNHDEEFLQQARERKGFLLPEPFTPKEYFQHGHHIDTLPTHAPLPVNQSPPIIAEGTKTKSSKKPGHGDFETMGLKAPVDFFARLDRWREQHSDGTMIPSRPATIRWIVHNFLLGEEEAKKKG
jgi:hypothetical protein